MAKKKNKNLEVVIDQKKCLGCGTCVALVPEVFEMGKDGKAKVKKFSNVEEEKIKTAVDACPAQAIKILKK